MPAADITNHTVQMTSSAHVKVARIAALILNALESVCERIKTMTVTMMAVIGKTRLELVMIGKAMTGRLTDDSDFASIICKERQPN